MRFDGKTAIVTGAAGGIGKPRAMRGRPVQERITGPAEGVSPWPDDVFIQISEDHCGRAIRTARWKYSVRAPGKTGQDPNSDVYVEDFLYDLAADPHERSNLVADPALAEARTELAARLRRRMVEAGEAVPEIGPA